MTMNNKIWLAAIAIAFVSSMQAMTAHVQAKADRFDHVSTSLYADPYADPFITDPNAESGSDALARMFGHMCSQGQPVLRSQLDRLGRMNVRLICDCAQIGRNRHCPSVPR